MDISNMDKALRLLEEQAQRCVSCGQCAQVCDIARAVAPLAPGAVACRGVLGEMDQKGKWFIPRCSLCRLCENVCTEQLPICDMVVACRNAMIHSGDIQTQPYRAMWVDYDWNAITLYRDTYKLFDNGDAPDDAQVAAAAHGDTDPCRVAYLPGCSLANEAPELTTPVVEWLEGHYGCEVGLELDCCGMPLFEMGLLERANAFEDALWSKLHARGVEELVVACPNCVGRLQARGAHEGIQVVTIYELMAADGVRAPVAGDGTVTVHDSCPARNTQMGTWVRSLLADWQIIEMQHCGDCSICCGSGGAVAMFDYTVRDVRASRRVEEFQQTGAQMCATYCMSSCNTLHQGLASGHMRHVLELVFGICVDHAAYQQRSQAMWEGEWGAYNSYRLENARPCS